ncbi:hypothetical protein GV67_12780 [Pseudorhizobium pelagicum]|uniref:Uncharacterized protein n=1 Tax=Pseudorhizobium pelagicum TaxID=1509405 RepID=A0A922P1C7_9HYPH|nr:hypothetical protein GV67_12780 [Pseudorhizobium pelagicum]KEQ08215.1 hypothetical protein GV68_02620 [Pseudorhizobium pelagicum]
MKILVPVKRVIGLLGDTGAIGLGLLAPLEDDLLVISGSMVRTIPRHRAFGPAMCRKRCSLR